MTQWSMSTTAAHAFLMSKMDPNTVDNAIGKIYQFRRKILVD